MPAVRVYVPAGRAELDEFATTGVLSAGPGTPREAYAVTPGLARVGGGHDLETLEYSAFCDAVEAAGRRRGAAGDRRVVVAADADRDWVVPREGTPISRIVLTGGLPLSRVASFHIDEEAGAGDPSLGASDAADDLLWYDVTEFDEVRGLLG